MNVIKLKVGFTKNGVPVEERELRPPKKTLENNIFRNPGDLIVSLIECIIAIILSPIKDIIKYYFSKPKSLKGRVCFVTGSGRGFGRELCLALAEEGAVIACADINENTNAETGKLLSEKGAKFKIYKLNVANKKEVADIAEQVEADLGPVYLLVNNAALVLPVYNPSEEYIRTTYDVNVLGPIWTMTTFLEKMKERNEGHILNISSIAALYGMPLSGLYGSTKAALTTYSQALRLELFGLNPKNNIHVTCVHPTTMNTSADYVDLMDYRMNFIDPRPAVKETLNAVKYNKTDISIPAHLGFIAFMLRFFNLDATLAMIKVVKVEVTLPTEKEGRLLNRKIFEEQSTGLKPVQKSN